MNNIIIRGVKNIKKVMIRKNTDNLVKEEGKYVERKWVLIQTVLILWIF